MKTLKKCVGEVVSLVALLFLVPLVGILWLAEKAVNSIPRKQKYCKLHPWEPILKHGHREVEYCQICHDKETREILAESGL